VVVWFLLLLLIAGFVAIINCVIHLRKDPTMKFFLTLLVLSALFALTMAQDSSTAPAAPTPAPTPAAIPGPHLHKVAVLHPPRPIEHLLKPRGNYSYRPLLDNGREFLKIEPRRKWVQDGCNGCPVPEKVEPIENPWNVVVRDRHGELVVVRHKKKKLLPVQPELRERLTWEQKRWLREQERLRYLQFGPEPLDTHEAPEFYPNKKHWKRRPDKEHHTHVVRRLPSIPHFYPQPEARRIYNPKKGWPKLHCPDKPCSLLPIGDPVPQE